MKRSRAAAAVAAFVFIGARVAAGECPRLSGPAPREALANDNRVSAGSVREGTLTVRIVALPATWHPDGASGCALRVNVFAEEGKPATIPGPLIHVRAGTEVAVVVRNALAKPLWLRGLQDRTTGSVDSVEIAQDSTRTVRFRATAAGAWYYWGGGTARFPVSNEDGQLVGALIVDDTARREGGAAAHSIQERVMVMTRWTPTGTTGLDGFQLNAVNGRSWPATERLRYTVGDSLHWHVINASDELHMMHLHGFYFRIDTRGDAAHDSVLTRQRPPTRVSVAVRRGEWMSITWSPDRSGNWLFHCHILAHMSGAQRLTNFGTDAAGRHEHGGTTSHATDAMGGLVLGVTVRPARNSSGANPGRADLPPNGRRLVHLFVDRRARVFGDLPGFGFVVQAGSQIPARDSIRIPGSPLLLERGKPVAVVVHNRLTTPAAIHWHGIELESYYDGVGGWSGLDAHIAPMIPPDSTFVARFTPPRAGTFIYHIHSESGDELASGLYGPLIVLDPDKPFDERYDHVFVIAADGPKPDHAVAVNGSRAPDTLRLVAGETHRVRLIDISANDVHLTTLRGPDGPVSWRLLAHDGWDVSSAEREPRVARTVTSAGTTQDYEIALAVPGDYTLVVAQAITAGATPTGRVTTVAIRVGASEGRGKGEEGRGRKSGSPRDALRRGR